MFNKAKKLLKVQFHKRVHSEVCSSGKSLADWGWLISRSVSLSLRADCVHRAWNKSWFAQKRAALWQLVSAAAAFFPFRLNKHERGRSRYTRRQWACSPSMCTRVCERVQFSALAFSMSCVLLGDEIPAAEAKSSAAASSNASSLQSASDAAPPAAADSEAPSASVSLLFVKNSNRVKIGLSCADRGPSDCSNYSRS